jgi:hypothetical protein
MMTWVYSRRSVESEFGFQQLRRTANAAQRIADLVRQLAQQGLSTRRCATASSASCTRPRSSNQSKSMPRWAARRDRAHLVFEGGCWRTAPAPSGCTTRVRVVSRSKGGEACVQFNLASSRLSAATSASWRDSAAFSSDTRSW